MREFCAQRGVNLYSFQVGIIIHMYMNCMYIYKFISIYSLKYVFSYLSITYSEI